MCYSAQVYADWKKFTRMGFYAQTRYFSDRASSGASTSDSALRRQLRSKMCFQVLHAELHPKRRERHDKGYELGL